MIPTKEFIKVFSSHLLAFATFTFAFSSKNTHKCFRERVTIYLEKPRKSARETLFFALFKLEFNFLQEC